MDKDAIGFIVPMKVSLNKQFNAMNFVNRLLRLGFAIFWAKKQFTAKTEMFPDGYLYSAGDFIIPSSQATPLSSKSSEGFVRTLIKELSEDSDSIIHPIKEGIRVEAYQLSTPRIAIYSGPGTYCGYLWYQQCLEKLGFMAECLTPSEIKDGRLKDFHVHVQPGGDETRQSEALWPEGREEIRKFLRKGGKYLGSCGGLDIAGYADGTSLGCPHSGKIKHLNLIEYEPTRNVPRSDFPHDEWAKSRYLHIDFNEYSQLIPVDIGTFIPVRVRQSDSPIVFGYPDVILPGLWYGAGPLPKELGSNVISVAEFAPDLLPIDSPWTLPPDYAFKLLEGASAIVVATYSRGKLVLFAPHPEEPNCEEHFRLVANAVFFLTGKGPFEIEVSSHKSEPYSINKPPTKEKEPMTYQIAGQSSRAVSEVKHEFKVFESTWSKISKKLADWTYKHVPEWVLKLPGYSNIWMEWTGLEIEVPKCKFNELLYLIPRLDLNYQKLCELELRLSRRSGKEATAIKDLTIISKNSIHDAVKRILVEAALLKDLIIEANQRLEYLKPKREEICQTRAEIEKLKQPPAIEDKLMGLWQKLDRQQYEFDLKIWGEILLKIDGKAEVPIFSEWKEGIIERKSKGVAPELVKLKFMAEKALENSMYSITAADYLLMKEK